MVQVKKTGNNRRHKPLKVWKIYWSCLKIYFSKYSKIPTMIPSSHGHGVSFRAIEWYYKCTYYHMYTCTRTFAYVSRERSKITRTLLFLVSTSKCVCTNISYLAQEKYLYEISSKISAICAFASTTPDILLNL